MKPVRAAAPAAGFAHDSETPEKRTLRVAASIPIASENCVMCRANFLGEKGNIGALAYTVPVVD